VHERSLDSDFLLLLLKRLIPRRPDLKIILMSATADLERFRSYFQIKEDFSPAVLSFPGRTFPVKEFYLQDILDITGWRPEPNENRKRLADEQDDFTYDEFNQEKENTLLDDLDIKKGINMELLEAIVVYTVKLSLTTQEKGSILVFLPGVFEIKSIQDRLEVLMASRIPIQCVVFPLYSDLPAAEQSKVFGKAPPDHVKVVLSTNIAETGLTIPDATYVIDTAKAREITYDPNRHLTCLKEIVVSKANCKQRRGRAGRTRPGQYFSLLTRDAFNKLPEYRPPEILRLPLEDICLKARATLGSFSSSGSLVELFSQAIDPPPSKNVAKAVLLLRQIQAMNSFENLTSLGLHLANLGVDVRLGKMLLYASALRCLDPILTIAASLSLGKSPFFRPFGDFTEYKRVISKFQTEDSDLLMISNAYTAWLKMKNEGYNRLRSWCDNNFLNLSNLRLIDMTRNQIFRSLVDAKIIPRGSGSAEALNVRGDSMPLVLCTMSACLFPNVMYKKETGISQKPSLIVLGKSTQVSPHQHSVIHGRLPIESAWFSSHVIKARKHDSSAIAFDLNRLSPLGMISLVAGDLRVDVSFFANRFFQVCLCMSVLSINSEAWN
jgi:HrpA-like RNA helicase